MCEHKNTTEGTNRPFNHSVAVAPFTEENRAAHGGYVVTETCSDCDATRSIARNGGHVEFSPWQGGRKIRGWTSAELAALVAK